MVCTLDKNNVVTIKKALKVLGKKNLVFIMHNGSFPAELGENTGFGTINSTAGKKFIDYAAELFDAIQMGPAGKTKSSDSSPYCGTIFSNNPLFIDLKQLTTNKWNNILSSETFNEIVENNPNKDTNKTSYSYAVKQYSRALSEAYDNFVKQNNKQLNAEFETYKQENDSWLDKDSLYEALSIEHGNDYWYSWKSKTDKNLFNPKSNEEKMEFGNRINEISKKYAKEIDEYKFIQFVLNKQNLETKKYADQKGIKMIADRQVAFSDRDTWAYQSLFLEGWCLRMSS